MLTCTRSAEQFREADFTSLKTPGSIATKHDLFPNGFKQVRMSEKMQNRQPVTHQPEAEATDTLNCGKCKDANCANAIASRTFNSGRIRITSHDSHDPSTKGLRSGLREVSQVPSEGRFVSGDSSPD